MRFEYVSESFVIDQKKINLYASLSGGTGRIHIDPDYAKESIFKNTLIHGTYLLTLIEKELLTFCRKKIDIKVNNYKIDSTFKNPVFSNEEFIIRITFRNKSSIQYELLKNKNIQAVVGSISLN